MMPIEIVSRKDKPACTACKPYYIVTIDDYGQIALEEPCESANIYWPGKELILPAILVYPHFISND